MKKLLSPGVTLVLNSRGGPVSLLGPGVRPFGPFSFVLEDDPPFDLIGTVALAGGHHASYRYPGLGDRDGLDEHRLQLLAKNFSGPGFQFGGGLLFNGSVRSTCSGKVLLD